jgi:hypothetical protein
MTEKAPLRKQFSRDHVYVVSRSFVFSGRGMVPGEIFDKTQVNTRRLRLLYEQRYIRIGELSQAPQEPAPAPRERRRLRNNAQSSHP